MNNMNKIITLILCGLISASALVSCAGDSTSATPNESEKISSQETTAETTEEIVSDNVPELDFDGAEFRVATSWNVHYNGKCDTEEMSGDVLNDAIYSRNREAESRFNVVFKELSDKADSIVKTVRNTITAGDEGYNIMMVADRSTFSFAQEGYLYNYKDIPYVDLSKPYWAKLGNDNMTIKGSLYGAFGDVSLPGLDYSHVMAFNIGMIESYKLESPYDAVQSNTWTLDKYSQLAKTVVTDVDGDGAWTDKDIYGHVACGNFIFPNFWIASDVQTVKKDDNGIPYFASSGDEKLTSVYDKLISIMHNNGIWYTKTDNSNVYFEKTTLFQTNQALFADHTFYTISKLRDMESDFGIIPYPKWDENQESYHAWVEGGCQTISVPMNTPDLDESGALIEALCCISYHSVIPAYYEISLKQKYTRDSVSAEMFDIIRESRTFDLGDTFWFSVIRSTFGGLFPTKGDLTSHIEKNKSKIDSTIAESLKFFE